MGEQVATVPSKVLTGRSAVLTVPSQIQASEDTTGSCFVRFHKEYIIYYNFESAFVKLQFPLCILTIGVDLSKILGGARSGQSAMTDDIIGVSGATCT